MPTLTAGQQTKLEQDKLEIREFVWIEAKDPDTGAADPVGFWTGVGSKTISGKTYVGSGALGRAELDPGKGDMSIPNLTLELSGIKAEVANAIRGSAIAQVPVTYYFGLYDTTTKVLEGGLITMFSGFLNTCKIDTPKSGGLSVITVVCVSTSSEGTIASTETRSHSSQQIRKTGDTFFIHVDRAQTQQIFFGTRPHRGHHKENRRS